MSAPVGAARGGHLQGRLAVKVFLCFAAAYFMSFALRSISAVIAPELVRDFGLGNAQLGSLSAAYFLGFAAMQLPLGIWLDRFGARRTHATMLLSAVAGCAGFALATDPAMLWVSRALIGAGMAGALMSALKAFRFWYPFERQQQLAAWMLVVGNFGALSTTVPVQAMLPTVGWRGVFWIAFALVLAAAVGILTQLPRDEERSSAAHAGSGSPWIGYLEVFSDRYLWRMAVVNILTQSGFVAMQTLWAGPWFVRVLGLGPQAAAGALFALNLTMMVAFFALGWLMPRFNRAGVSIVGIIGVAGAVMIAIELAIAQASHPDAWMLWLALGMASSPFTMVQSHVSLTFPAALTGRAFTAFNLLVFSGVFLLQWLFGVGVDTAQALGATESQAFRHTIVGWAGLQAIGLVVLFAWRAQPRAAA